MLFYLSFVGTLKVLGNFISKINMRVSLNSTLRKARRQLTTRVKTSIENVISSFVQIINTQINSDALIFR